MEEYSRNLVSETSKQYADTSHLFRSTNPAFEAASEYGTALHHQAPVNRVAPDFYDPDVVAMETGWNRNNERRSNVVVSGNPDVMEMVTSRNPKAPFKAIYVSLDQQTGPPRPVTEYSATHRPCYRIGEPRMPVSPVDPEGYVRPRKDALDSPWYTMADDTPKKTRYDTMDRPYGINVKAGLAAALMAMLLVFPVLG